MIDYDKLKLAHELLSDYSHQTGTLNSLECRFGGIWNFETYIQFPDDTPSERNRAYQTIDEVIIRFEELTQPKPKYEIREFIWVLDDSNKPAYKRILDQRWDDFEKEYVCELTDCLGEPYWITGNSLYPTKSELIEAQISYWQSLREIQPGQDGTTGPMGYYPAFEGEIKGFSDKHATEKSCDDVVTECSHDGSITCRKCNTSWTTGFKVIDKQLVDALMSDKSISYYHCGHCGEDIAFDKICPCCGNGSSECQHDWSLQVIQNGARGWKCTLCDKWETNQECQHESDGHRYDTRKLRMEYVPIDKTWDELLEIGCHNKCLKCGEFYR